MPAVLTQAVYRDLLAVARRQARGRMDADDLLHQALLAALAAGRGMKPEDRPWMAGVMRNIAMTHARGSLRRRRRETAFAQLAPAPATDVAEADLPHLPVGLRIVALLALAGQTRGEIRHLLRISDETLRQRLSALRRHLKTAGVPSGLPGLKGALAFGSIRRSLLPVIGRTGADFASHDPDGHPIVFKIVRG